MNHLYTIAAVPGHENIVCFVMEQYTASVCFWMPILSLMLIWMRIASRNSNLSGPRFFDPVYGGTGLLFGGGHFAVQGNLKRHLSAHKWSIITI